VLAAMRGLAASALGRDESRSEDDEDLLDWLRDGLEALPGVARVHRIRVDEEGRVSEPADVAGWALLSDVDHPALRRPRATAAMFERHAEDGRVLTVAVPIASRGEEIDVMLAEADEEGVGISELERAAAATLGAQLAMGVAVRRARAEARLDGLTGYLNHAAMHEQLDDEIARAQRGSGRLACVMLDLDDFKAVNERQGHPVGDRLLRLVTLAMRVECRPYDICCRYGGDEFVVILPDAGIDDAAQTAERLRVAVAGAVLVHDGMEISVTATAGVADWRPGESALELLARVDRALLAGKGTGKDSVARG